MEKMEALAELAEELECLDILVGDTPTMKKDMWAAHDAFHTSMESGAKNAFEYNITVPSEHIAEMVEYAKQLGKAKGLKVMAYAHAGSGGMHIHAVSDGDKTEFKTAVAETEGELYAKCVSLGGRRARRVRLRLCKESLHPCRCARSVCRLQECA